MNKIKKVYSNIAAWDPANYLLWMFFFLFIVLFFIVSFFHEPWGDEAQAWLIARDASYYDIIFTLPHYEGHPQLWWLILSIPAKLHMPYELSLTVVSMLISSVSAYLIFFKSPFCGVFKVTLPFTFFIFYQYGVISRPYCLLVLSLFLTSVFYERKDEHPFRYVSSLLLMCASSGFGITLAGGIVLVWCLEIIQKIKTIKDFSVFFRTKLFFSLLFLLIGVLFIIISIIPADDIFVWANEMRKINESRNPGYTVRGRILACLYMLFLIPADCMLSSYGIDSDLLSFCNKISITDIITLLVPSLFILAYFIDLTYRKGKFKLFIVPYLCFSVFSIFVYFNIYHIGILAVFFLSVMWICKNTKDDIKNGMIRKYCDVIEAIFVVSYIAVNLSWTFFCSVSDIKYDYDYGKQIYEYIVDNNYVDKNIMAMWKDYEINNEEIINTNVVYDPVSIAPYFEKNIFMNLNCKEPDTAYVLHKSSDSKRDFETWAKNIPDLLIGQVVLGEVYNGDIKISDFSMDAQIKYCRVWKFNNLQNEICIYKKSDF